MKKGRNILKRKAWYFLILCLTLVLLSGCIIETNADASLEMEFLKNNYAALDAEDNDDFSSFAMIDSYLEGKKVFFTAEDHGTSANSKLKLKFLKYFKEKAGIKYYFCELPYSMAFFINKYLETGSEEILKRVYEPLEGTYEWTKENYNHWKDIYEYNKSLPENEKITVVGVDIEHQLKNAFWYMYEHLSKDNPPQEIEKIIAEFRELAEGKKQSDKDDIKNFCQKLKKDIELKREVYEKYFGENLFGFELVNDNVLYQFEAYGAKDFNLIRDKRMYENFTRVYPRLPEGKFYGQWGMNHAFQSTQANVEWIAAYMNRPESDLSGKILSIIYLYDDCQTIKKPKYNSVKLQSASKYLGQYFEPLAVTDYTLLKLTGDASPFAQGINKLFIPRYCGDFQEGKSLTDFYQYIVYVKNSKANTALEQR